MDTVPYRYIGEPIEPVFLEPPVLEKTPYCPKAFRWQDEEIEIIELLSEWSDFKRRGRKARNMQPQHAARASLKGSRGVGRYYFQVLAADGRIFDIYYDRSPLNVDDQKGQWVILGERRYAVRD